MHIQYIPTINLHTKFHMPRSNGTLVTSIKTAAKFNVSKTATLLFYILHKKNLIKIAYFSKLYYHMSLEDHKLSSTCCTSTPH